MELLVKKYYTLSKMIQELMIINQAGLAVFYYNFISDEDINDEQSIASYFDIICRFTKQSFNESLKILELDSFSFFFYTHKSNYHLVLKCKNKLNDKQLLESISEKIIDNFIKEYKVMLQDFNGEISRFKPFSHQIIKILINQFKDVKDISFIEN